MLKFLPRTTIQVKTTELNASPADIPPRDTDNVCQNMIERDLQRQMSLAEKIKEGIVG